MADLSHKPPRKMGVNVVLRLADGKAYMFDATISDVDKPTEAWEIVDPHNFRDISTQEGRVDK